MLSENQNTSFNKNVAEFIPRKTREIRYQSISEETYFIHFKTFGMSSSIQKHKHKHNLHSLSLVIYISLISKCNELDNDLVQAVCQCDIPIFTAKKDRFCLCFIKIRVPLLIKMLRHFSQKNTINPLSKHF